MVTLAQLGCLHRMSKKLTVQSWRVCLKTQNIDYIDFFIVGMGIAYGATVR